MDQTDPLLGFAAIAFAALMLVFGLCIMARRLKVKGLGPYNLQGLGLVLLVPATIVAAALGQLESQALAAILGGVAGYVFGRGDDRPTSKAKPEEKSDKK